MSFWVNFLFFSYSKKKGKVILEETAIDSRPWIWPDNNDLMLHSCFFLIS